MKKNKCLYIVFSIIVFLGILTVFNFKNNNNNNDKIDNTKDVIVPIKLVYVDSNKTPENVKLNDVFEKYRDSYLYMSFCSLPAVKENDYYVLDLKKHLNSDSIKYIVDYVFAKNNIFGEVVNDVKYDIQNQMIYVPEKYYKNERNTIQLELVDRIDKEKFQNFKVDLDINNNKKYIYVDNKKENIEFSIYKYNKNKKINKSMINIYVNNSTERLPNESFYFDSITGKVSFDYPVSYVKNIKIDYEKNFLKKIFNSITGIINAIAKTYSEAISEASMYKLASAPVKVSNGTEFTENFTIHYGGTGGTGEPVSTTCGGSNLKTQSIDFSWKVITGAKTDCGEYGKQGNVYFTVDLPSKLTNSGGSEINFGVARTLNFDCVHISDDNVATTGSSVQFKIKVVSYDDTNNVLALAFLATRKVTTQAAWGIYRFNWEDAQARINVTKKFKDGNVDQTNSISDKSGVKIGLYSDSSCSTKIAEASTNTSGVATFGPSTVKLNTQYYIKETGLGSNFSSNNWNMDTSCKSVKVTKSSTSTTENNATVYVESKSVTNHKRYYCVKVVKQDKENNSVKLQGINFKLVGAETLTRTTDSSGVATFDRLSYSSSFTLQEVSQNSSNVENPTNQSNYYWNDNGLPTTHSLNVSAAEMNYNSNYEPTTCNNNASAKYTKEDRKVYYCLKVTKKDKATNEVIKNAEFTAYTSNGTEITKAVTGNDGIATLFLGLNHGNIKVKETKAPEGYASASPIEKTIFVGFNSSNNTIVNYMQQGTTLAESTTSVAKCTSNPESYVYQNPKLLINWYKDTELDKEANGAQFIVKKKGTNQYLEVTSPEYRDDDSNPVLSKKCYKYKKMTTEASATVMESMNTATKTGGGSAATTNGEVCVQGLPEGEYTVIEKKPAQYHTFSEIIEKNISTNTKFQAKSTANKFINIPTGFEFTKKVKENVDGGDGNQTIVVNGVEKTLTELTTEELKKLDFEIYLTDAAGNPTGNPLEFVLKNGIYEYVGNTIDGPGQTGKTTILHLNDNRKIRVDHLAWGTTYAIREVQSKVCDASKSEEDCIGYYYPNYSEQTSTFTITTCSNPSANTTSCPNGSNKYATQQLTNTPTEIQFTKKDFYHYNDQADIEDKDRESDEVDESVEFENDKERSDFDRITFKIKDSSGKYLTLKFIGNNGSCKDDNSYALYKYVPSDQTDAEGTELHTCGGHIRITNLCRGNDYKIEEISVPEDSVYVKENTGSTPTEVSYKIPCTDGSYTQESTTNLISDKPTRARFEKRDSKYNYLINDETTTFKLYRCDKGTECHPGDYTTDEERESNGMELVKFYERGVITGDEEDPNDAEGLIGVEVYRRMSDSDAEKQGAKIITELHPYRGILVMRYLQANYNYVLLETVAPKNYQMPIGRNAENPFTTTSETVDVDPVDIPNKPTSLLIKKYDSKGNLLPGAEFKIYEGTTCDKNLSAMNQPKKELKLKTIRDGIYENRETKDTYTIKTCTDKENEKCSDINPNGSLTRLTYETNLGTWTDFADESTRTEDGKKIEIQEGVALVQYLEYGHCYIIEEVKAPEGHTLPSKAEDRFTMITIDENDEYAHSTYYKFINKPTPFQFYKYDEFNKLIDGAEFKLQKLDDNKKYQDVTVTLDNDLENLATIDDTNSEELNKKIEEYQKQAEEGVPFYKVDKESSNTTITTKNGTAVVYYLQAGQYRILETKAPEGKELPKNPNIATFFVDENGNVYGNSVITNKSITKKIERKNEASAIFIIAPQTGQTVIKYGLLISLLVAVITGLIILKKKME